MTRKGVGRSTLGAQLCDTLMTRAPPHRGQLFSSEQASASLSSSLTFILPSPSFFFKMHLYLIFSRQETTSIFLQNHTCALIFILDIYLSSFCCIVTLFWSSWGLCTSCILAHSEIFCFILQTSTSNANSKTCSSSGVQQRQQ